MNKSTVVICLLLTVLIVAVVLCDDLQKEIAELRQKVEATQQTGIDGDRFQVTLTGGEVVIAGKIMSDEEAKEYYYEYGEVLDIVKRRNKAGQLIIVMARSRTKPETVTTHP